MNQTWENSKKPNFRPDWPQLGHQIFFLHGFYLCLVLDIVASYHCMQFQGKCMIQTQENGETPIFGPDLGPLGKFGLSLFFLQESGFVSQ